MRAIAISIPILLVLMSCPVGAQSRLPTDGGMTTSLGQPGPWSWSLGIALGLREDKAFTAGVGEARVGVYHEFLSRTLGVGGMQGELYNQSQNAKYAAGVRLRWVSQITGVALGADYSITEKRTRPIFNYAWPRAIVAQKRCSYGLDQAGDRRRVHSGSAAAECFCC